MAGISLSTSFLGCVNGAGLPNPPPFVTKVNDLVQLAIVGASPSKYQWGLSAGAVPGLVPGGGSASSTAALSSTTAPNPSFTVDAPGRFLISCAADGIFYQATLIAQ